MEVEKVKAEVDKLFTKEEAESLKADLEKLDQAFKDFSTAVDRTINIVKERVTYDVLLAEVIE